MYRYVYMYIYIYIYMYIVAAVWVPHFNPKTKTNSEDALAEDELKPEDDFPPEDEFRRRIGRRRNNFSVGQRKLVHGVVPGCPHP